MLGQDGEALLGAIISLIWMPRKFLSAFQKGWRKHSLYALDVETALEMDLEDTKRYITSAVSCLTNQIKQKPFSSIHTNNTF
ncbi:MAG: hypothetical protein CM1200mP9_09160 [Gammaproteobacteria bacterium]|nr:MAG: hypothetical protein CM1200mP9_09160 [Gammaproteobacteria bacterium]